MRCGSFQLEHRIARGGMGDVWFARHRQTPVALKFVAVDNERVLEMFADEVRAHARLQHPHILQILDHGVVKTTIPDGPTRGTPWFAMEYAAGGDISECAIGFRWSAIRVVLLGVLDALAHAHSHGVIHLDLKLKNILLSGPRDLRPGIKLADFGLAYIQNFRVDSKEPELMGTPAAMAPEQWRGAVREYGPWTDLYAVGCLAFRLVSYRWPFRGMEGAKVARGMQSPPLIDPQLPVPDGLAEWVAKLLCVQPQDRFQSAVDALFALMELPSVVDPKDRPLPAVLRSTRSALQLAYSHSWHEVPPTPSGRVPFSPDWRRPATAPPPLVLAEAGLGLFPLRKLETVERNRERTALWRALREVATARQARAVVVEGASGLGVSHLLRWIAQRSMALGVASGVVVGCEPDDDDTASLLRLLRTVLQVEGRAGEELREGISTNLRLHGQKSAALCRILFDLLEKRIRDPHVCGGAVLQVLCERSTAQSSVICFENPGPTVVSFVDRALARTAPTPIFFVLGVSTSLPHALRGDSVSTLVLRPLSRRGVVQLLQRALPLTEALQSQIVGMCKGNPGVAMEILSRLVRRDLLSPTGFGLQLKEGATLLPDPLPSDQRQLIDLLAELDEEAGELLVLAATMGRSVDEEAWMTLGEDHSADAALRTALVGRLKQRGLARVTPRGWRFLRTSFRQAVLQWGRAQGVAQWAHRKVAEHWSLLPIERRPLVKIARHLRAAGELERSVDTVLQLMRGARGCRRHQLLLSQAVQLCAQAGADLDQMDVRPQDPRRGELLSWEVLHTEDTASQVRIAKKLIEDGRRYGWKRAEMTGRSLAASHAAKVSDLRRFEQEYERAVALQDLADESPQMIRNRLLLTLGLLWIGRKEQAATQTRELCEIAATHGFRREEIRAQNLHVIARMDTPDEGLLPELLLTIKRARAWGYLVQAASMSITAGELSRRFGSLDDSDQYNREAYTLMQFLGVNGTVPLLNLAVNGLLRKDPVKVRKWLDRTRAESVFSSDIQISIAVVEVGWACLIEEAHAIESAIAGLEVACAREPRPLGPQEIQILVSGSASITSIRPDLAARIGRFFL